MNHQSPLKVLYSVIFGETRIEYLLDETSMLVGLTMCPSHLTGKIPVHRTNIADQPEIAGLPKRWANPAAWQLQSLVQLALVGDEASGGFAQGRTMLNGPATLSLKYERQEIKRKDEETHVLTTLRSERGFRCVHDLWHTEGDNAVRTRVVFHNESESPLGLAMLSSFHLGCLTPFVPDDAMGEILVHRFRSAWSAEGRLDTRSIDQLHLERSWIGHGAFSERFGQVGTMPVRGYFPFVVLEDAQRGVLWGAQLSWAGSWQMEIYRKDDFISISGGLADREFGHWIKRLGPGTSFTSPTAHLACVEGTLNDLTDQLTRLQIAAANSQPQVEHDLPIIFNEFCTTWGMPAHDKLVALADRLEGSSTRYLVIDAGWYGKGHGDWLPTSELYPLGLEATVLAIRQRGLIPGIWFEMENVGAASAAFSLIDHLLKRDGVPLTVAERRFWDLNDPFVVNYLSERVIGLLERYGFGYLKVDYNETLGIGVDHPDSLGEGLRLQVEGTYRLFEQIRARLPELVIENCASGGHRLEPSMMTLSSMGSFSDAHELKEIPIIAANLHHLILPRQSQIWAVLRRGDDTKRLTYSLAATFLGRMCLSGDVNELSEEQWKLVLEAQDFYRKVWPIIKHGKSRRVGTAPHSWRHPRGWQAIVRVSDSGHEALAVIHSFAEPKVETVHLELPLGLWQIVGCFMTSFEGVQIIDNRLICPINEEFSGAVIHMQRAH